MQSIVIITVFTCISLIYGAVLLLVLISFFRFRVPPAATAPLTVSVIIAARNEATRIRPCLESLENLRYPSHLFDITIVDDASTDETADIISSFCSRHTNWKLLRIPAKSNTSRGKTNALMQAVENSLGEIIVATDADCIVQPSWLNTLVPYFRPGVVMALGYYLHEEGKGFFHRFLEFDNVISCISVLAPATYHYAFASMGGNLAFRRDAYSRSGGFAALQSYKSGDDTYLTERFRIKKLGDIVCVPEHSAMVRAQLPHTRREVWNQQVRKNSRHLRKSPSSEVASVLLLCSYAVPFFLLAFAPSWRIAVGVFLGIRFLAEFACLSLACSTIRQTHLIPLLALMQIIYPPYIVFFSIVGFFKMYRWKT